MKKVLLATTAVAAFVAFSGVAQAQDPGRPDVGATEGGGGAGSAFTITVSGAVKLYLKYASGSDTGVSIPANREAEADLKLQVDNDKAVADAETALTDAETALTDARTALAAAGSSDADAADDDVTLAVIAVESAEKALEAAGAPPGGASSDGFFTLSNADLEINGAATTDGGTDIEVHLDFNFSGNESDSTAVLGGSEQDLNIGRFVRVDELSVKIGGNWGSVQMGRDDGAEDTFKIYGASVAAGTGGIDGDHHTVIGGVNYAGTGGQAVLAIRAMP